MFFSFSISTTNSDRVGHTILCSYDVNMSARCGGEAQFSPANCVAVFDVRSMKVGHRRWSFTCQSPHLHREHSANLPPPPPSPPIVQPPTANIHSHYWQTQFTGMSLTDIWVLVDTHTCTHINELRGNMYNRPYVCAKQAGNDTLYPSICTGWYC